MNEVNGKPTMCYVIISLTRLLFGPEGGDDNLNGFNSILILLGVGTKPELLRYL